MIHSQGKRFALAVILLTAASLGVSAYAHRTRIAEEYWLSRLDGSDETNRVVAVERLGEMRSRRAVLRLTAILCESAGRKVDFLRSPPMRFEESFRRRTTVQIAAIEALRKIGEKWNRGGQQR